MARLYNVEVFRKVINTGVTYYSSPELESLLGSADEVTLQVIVDATPGATTVTAQYQSANESTPISAGWEANANFPSATASPASTTDVPKNGMSKNNSTFALGSKGRIAVSCSAQYGVPVRVIACGRSRKDV